MRRLTRKAMISFNIFAAAVLLMAALFVTVIVSVTQANASAYLIPAGSTVFDKSDYAITTMVDGRITKAADDNYLLSLTDDGGDYNLGRSVVTYQQSSGQVRLYGSAYRVYGDGSVNKLSGETRIDDVSTPAFYKLADRKYVLIGSAIQSSDQLFQASSFLYVVIDKNGNAQLLNDLINLKTVEPMVLLCGDVSFNVAEEQLTLADNKIDLTRILGTSNEYSPEAAQQSENNIGENGEIIVRGGDGGDGGAGGSGGTGGTGGTGGKGGTGVAPDDKEEEYDFSLNNVLSLRGVKTTANSVEISYMINDPTGEYAMAFLRVRSFVDDGLGNAFDQKIGLNASANKQIVTGLSPGAQYVISIGYRPLNAADTDPDRITDSVKVATRSITAQMAVTRLSKDEVTFSLLMDASFKIDAGEIVLYADNTEQGRVAIDTAAACSLAGWTSSLTYKGGTNLELRFENTVFGGKPISLAYSNVKIVNSTSSASLSPLSVVDEYTADTSKNDPVPSASTSPEATEQTPEAS